MRKESDKVQKRLPQFCGSPIGKGSLQADFHLNGILAAQRYDVAIHGLAVHGHTGLAGAPHVHHILGAPELPGDGVFLPVIGNAGLNPQTLIVRVNTQDGLPCR